MSDRDDLLQILEAHGKQFLQSFGPSTPGKPVRRKATDKARPSSSKRPKLSKDESNSGEEWAGIQTREPQISEESSGSAAGSYLYSSASEREDDGLTAGGSAIVDANVVVFSERSFKTERISKARVNAFMSSKVSKIRDNGSVSSPVDEGAPKGAEDERTNAENDALLHKLVHTKLLSGSLTRDLDLTPARRHKALAGRVMELAGGVSLGKGEKAVRQTERNRAAKNVREGLAQKQNEREKQELEEAKNLGNYHPTLKKLYEPPGASTPRSRPRGLKMGVGKFHGGILQLNKQDIAAINGRPRHSGRKRSRGRK